MGYYGYQYKRQCYVPGGVKYTTPVFRHCHNPCVVKCTSCTPCAPEGANLCTVRETVHTIPKCSAPCSSQCVETHIVQDHSSSCSPRSSHLCTTAFPQPQMQGRGHLCVPHCGQQGIARCSQTCTPAHVCQYSSYPYSYQWSDSYHYNCGHQ